nr:MAG TPA: hypothetical protein [Caudoviricetes sp.]
MISSSSLFLSPRVIYRAYNERKRYYKYLRGKRNDEQNE